MRIAVVSNPTRSTGKTALSLLMGYFYPYAVGGKCAYITNKSLSEVLKYTKCSEVETSVEKSISVFSALLRTEAISADEVSDYAYTPNNNGNLMMFDAYNTTENSDVAVGDFLNLLKLLGNTFTVVDLSGGIKSKEVSTIVDACDVILYTFRCNHRDLEDFYVYYNGLSDSEKLKVVPVCTAWDDRGVSKGMVKSKIKLKPNKIEWQPYNQNIEKLMLDGNLELVMKMLVTGENCIIPLRDPIIKLLSLLLDSKQGKVVKEFSKWGI